MFKVLLKFLPLIIHEVADIIKEKIKNRKIKQDERTIERTDDAKNNH